MYEWGRCPVCDRHQLFSDFVTKKDLHYALSWGIHPEDVAAEKVEVGAALILSPDIIEKQLDDGRQLLYISKPTQSITTPDHKLLRQGRGD